MYLYTIYGLKICACKKKPQLYILYLHNCKYIARKKSVRNYAKLSQCGVDWIGVTFKGIFNCTV